MIVFDCEIERAIPSRNEARIEGIEYCNGWTDFIGMGISCICTLDTKTWEPRVFLADNMDEFKKYVLGQVTAGFNSERFDLPLLKAHGVDLDTEHFDMIRAIWASVGLNGDKYSPATHSGWKLQNIMVNTFGLSKGDGGAMAPVHWQQGRRGHVIDYCARDNWLEAKLLVHLFDSKPIICKQGTLPTYLGQPYIKDLKEHV